MTKSRGKITWHQEATVTTVRDLENMLSYLPPDTPLLSPVQIRGGLDADKKSFACVQLQDVVAPEPEEAEPLPPASDDPADVITTRPGAAGGMVYVYRGAVYFSLRGATLARIAHRRGLEPGENPWDGFVSEGTSGWVYGGISFTNRFDANQARDACRAAYRRSEDLAPLSTDPAWVEEQSQRDNTQSYYYPTQRSLDTAVLVRLTNTCFNEGCGGRVWYAQRPTSPLSCVLKCEDCLQYLTMIVGGENNG